MQVCDCRVRLNGKLDMEIPKKGVTVAEIVVLRHIHGDDAVVKVRPTINDKRSHAAELDRLRKDYGETVVDALWPGYSPRLPATMKDIGLDHKGTPDEDDEEPVSGEPDAAEGDDGNDGAESEEAAA